MCGKATCIQCWALQIHKWRVGLFTFHLSARGSLDTGSVSGWCQGLGPGPDLFKICRCLEGRVGGAMSLVTGNFAQTDSVIEY